jgi:hypothetical protein
MVTPLIYVGWALSETYRLYLGWTGNLQERVPQLAAFFFMTILEFVFIAFCLVVQPKARSTALLHTATVPHNAPRVLLAAHCNGQHPGLHLPGVPPL